MLKAESDTSTNVNPSQALYFSVLSAIALLSLFLSWYLPACWDVAWRVEIADRIVAGQTLYTDVIELNPPLWFWSAVPSAFIAKLFDIPSFYVLCFGIAWAAYVGLFLLDRCCQPLISQSERQWLVGMALVSFVMLPLANTGQREIPVLLASLLWAMLAARRSQNIATPNWLIVGISIFAAYGFALKHYYLIIPIGIELWLMFKLTKSWKPWRLENILLAGLGLGYGLSILKFAPNYLTDIVPLIKLSYDDVRASNVATSQSQMLSILQSGMMMIGTLFFIQKFIAKQDTANVLALTACLQLGAVFLQGKGFHNHFFATQGVIMVVWGYACGHLTRTATKPSFNPKIGVAWLILACVVQPAFASAKSNAIKTLNITEPKSALAKVMMEVDNLPKSSRIFVTSTHAGLAFYLQWTQDRPHFSRYFALWMLPGLYSSLQKPELHDAAANQLALVRTNTIADIKCSAPQFIIADTTTHGRLQNASVQQYDIKPMNFLFEDTQFEAWINDNYEASSEVLGVTIWRSNLPDGPSVAPCANPHR